MYTLIATLIIIVIGILSFFITPVEDIVRGILGVFVSGKSAFKLYGFIAYSLLIAGAVYLPLRLPKPKTILVTGLVSLYLLGLGMFVYVYTVHAIPFSEYSIVFNNGDISSTSIGHNHIPKGVIGTGLQFLGMDALLSADAGHAYIGIIPQWAFFLFGVLLSITVYAALVVSKHMQPVSHRILFALTSFALLELSFDGGIADQKVPLLFGALLILLYGVHKKTTLFFIGGSIASVVSAYVLSTQEVLGSAATIGHALWGIATAMILYIAFFFAKERLRVLLLIAATITFYPLLTYVFSVWQYRNTPITQEAIVTTEKILEGYVPIDQIGALSVYRVEGYDSVRSLHKYTGLSDQYYPTIVPGVQCFPKGQQARYTFSFWSPDVIDTTYTTRTTRLSLKDTQGELLVAPCIPRHLNILETLISPHSPVIIYGIQ